MGKSIEEQEQELNETFAKLERMIPEDELKEMKRINNLPERTPIIHPKPLPRMDYLPQPQPRRPQIFDEPKSKPKNNNPWIPVAIIGIILIAGAICYFGYNLSKQTPPQTFINASPSCTPAPCTNSASCGACTCTPQIEGSNITCMPSIINFYNKNQTD